MGGMEDERTVGGLEMGVRRRRGCGWGSERYVSSGRSRGDVRENVQAG